jgi:hypothetical protein
MFLKVPERGSVTPSLIVSAARPVAGSEAKRITVKRIRETKENFFMDRPSFC